MKKIYLLAVAVMGIVTVNAQPSVTVNQKVSALISKMTPEEKVWTNDRYLQRRYLNREINPGEAAAFYRCRSLKVAITSAVKTTAKQGAIGTDNKPEPAFQNQNYLAFMHSLI
ncbi:hypothetical protein GS399_13030 [Pedobacter sp. HMF7647]|uniref:Uncharacterized protein n=1 Tax=Hufsiella arboris TaxID=2695275 RepID=A0A7K1YBC9_9SPHI|nr:hypothetical protein [Hufsiella arboris]MXV51902.1 hypothetical protein [Hufsiella arboris]